MKKILLAFLFGICFTPVFSQTTYNGSLTNTDLKFNRPDEGMPPAILSSLGTNVYYNVIAINVTAAGFITFTSNSIWDNFAILYDPSGFIPASPLINALIANDDFTGTNAGFTYNFTSTGTYYLVICSLKNNVTGTYTISTSAGAVLPLKLVSFTAIKSGGNSNIIKWGSVEEQNLTSYQVQRSKDANKFIDLTNGSIIAKNNTASNAYSVMDNDPAAGFNYYRLKIMENSGRVSYSHVALVKNNKPGITNMSVYPNPASDYLLIETKSMLNSKAYVSIINTMGEIVQSSQYSFNNQGVLSVDIRKLPAGKYFIKTTIDKDEATVAFIKN